MNINNFGLLNTLFGIINNGEQDNDYAVAAFANELAMKILASSNNRLRRLFSQVI